MTDIIPADEQSNYETFRECLSEPVLRILAKPIDTPKTKKKRKLQHAKKGSKSSVTPLSTEHKIPLEPIAREDAEPTHDDAEDLGEFIDYLTSLIFPSLPATLRTLSHPLYKSTPSLQALYSLPLTPSTTSPLLAHLSPLALENLSSYSLLPSPPDPTDIHNFFTPILTPYITSVTSAPPPWSSTRTSACELCQRDWINLTYHHLIPRSTHERVLKRGWHAEERLGSVAWLCRACHSFVHRVASNEELAREWYTVELLEGRDDVKEWVRWVGRVRWKAR
ncbi:hypothetical protein B0J11DRAFT_587433 [Dendryphion nanum]|uniref:Uncharacterized protein n=1 Tax=Dendryphion nanum TaxID=256645 RepID=A0A9P9EJM5_9PLEO|nr:hypothetical protein B0J11DRAFT_587433 [Dendryphion nanum]